MGRYGWTFIGRLHRADPIRHPRRPFSFFLSDGRLRPRTLLHDSCCRTFGEAQRWNCGAESYARYIEGYPCARPCRGARSSGAWSGCRIAFRPRHLPKGVIQCFQACLNQPVTRPTLQTGVPPSKPNTQPLCYVQIQWPCFTAKAPNAMRLVREAPDRRPLERYRARNVEVHIDDAAAKLWNQGYPAACLAHHSSSFRRHCKAALRRVSWADQWAPLNPKSAKGLPPCWYSVCWNIYSCVL